MCFVTVMCAPRAPFYGVYETRDGKYMAVGAIEPQFWKELLDKLQLSASEVDVPEQNDPNTWCG